MPDIDDYEAIRGLIHEYCFRLDAGDLDGVAALFEWGEFGSSTRPGVAQGVAAVRAIYDNVIIYDDGRPGTLHCVVNTTISFDLSGSEATARSYFTVLQGVAGFPLQPILAGEYRDRFALRAGVWTFAQRIVHPDRLGDLRQHMRGASAPG